MTGYDVIKWHSTPELTGEYFSIQLGKIMLDRTDAERMNKELLNPKNEFILVPIYHSTERREIDKNGYMWSYKPNYRFKDLRKQMFSVDSKVVNVRSKYRVRVEAEEFFDTDGSIALKLTVVPFNKSIKLQCDLFPETNEEVANMLRYRIKF